MSLGVENDRWAKYSFYDCELQIEIGVTAAFVRSRVGGTGRVYFVRA